MSDVNPLLRPRLEELSPELQSAILARDVPLNNLRDLIGVLEDLISESE